MHVRGRLYPPGARRYSRGRRNRWYVYVVRIAGAQREFVCRDEGGRPTADARVAKRDVRRIDRKAEREAAGRRGAAAPAGPVLTFADAAARYADGRNLRKAERKFVDRLAAELGHRTLAGIRQHDIDAAARALYGGAAPATRNRQAYAPAAAILHYAAENDWCEYRRIRKQKEPRPETRRPAPGTLGLLLANAGGLQRLLLLVLERQGWRIGEALAWRQDKIDLAAGMTELWVPKAGLWKTVPLAAEVVAALANRTALERDHDFVDWRGRIRPLRGARPLHVFPWAAPGAVYRWLRPLCRKLGVRFTPHMARHEFASSAREHGATARDLVDAGTWTSERSTARYDHARADRARAIVNRGRG